MELAHLQLRNKERESIQRLSGSFSVAVQFIWKPNYLFLSRFFKDFSNTCDVERTVCKRKSPPFQYFLIKYVYNSVNLLWTIQHGC